VSEKVDLKEFVGAFVTEATEHLESAIAKLLLLEGAARSGEPMLRHMRDVFRALHTIKGLAAMVGVEPIVAIAHRMEAILRDADRASSPLTAEAIDTLLEGARAIDARIKVLARGGSVPDPPPSLIARLDELDAQPLTKSASLTSTIALDPALAQKLSPAELEHLAHAAGAGLHAFRADFFPSPARAEQGFTINRVRERVAAIGELVKVIPLSVPANEHAPGGLAFVLLVVTSKSREDIATAVGIDAAALEELGPPTALIAEPVVADEPEELVLGEPARRGIVRVDVTRLDEAMDRLSSLVVSRFRLSREATRLAQSGIDVRNLQALLGEHARQLRDLRAAILKVRMVPIAEVLDRVPMILRSLRRSVGKAVRLEIQGGAAELDKAVAERLFPAIVHLVRNAVDHAIETPDERVRRGKPAEGTVSVSCTEQGSARLVLSVSDDGRGIDRELLARRAESDLPTNDAELLELLCRPGLSTRDEVSTVSGRGMGLDIIRRVAVEQLGGELTVSSVWGVGTTFTMTVPLTVSIIDAFAFECAGQRFVVPVAIVDEIVEIDDRLAMRIASNTSNVRVFMRRGESVPILPLEVLFRLGEMRTGVRKAIVVRRAGEPIAFAVDRMLGQQEVVVRPLEDPLVQVTGITGATDLGDGSPTLVVDLVALGANVRMTRGAAA
jgi:two-component system, chemotaxis family, sensor kinase CheA